MNLQVISTYDAFLTLEPDWNRLLSSRAQYSVFDTFVWNRLWLKHFQHQYELHCLILFSKSPASPASQGGRNLEISNIIPLVKIGHKFYLTGALDRDRGLFLTPPSKEDFGTVANYLSSTNFTHLEFRNLPIKETWDLKWILEGLHVPHKLNLKKEYFIPPSQFSLTDRPVANEMERKMRRLKSQGELTYQCLTDSVKHPEYLNFLFEHNESRSLDKNYRQRFVDSHYRDWFREMLASKVLNTHPCAVTVNDNIVAVEIGFRYGDLFSNYSTAFDPAWFRFSPGMIRVPMQSQWAKTLGIRELRLGSGEMGYKQQFTDDYNQLAHVMLFRNRFIQFLYELKNLISRIRHIRPIQLIRSILRAVLLYPLYLLNLHRIFERANESRIRILCYHKVNDSNTSPLTVTVKAFTKQLEFLKHQFTILPLSEIKRTLLEKRPLPVNAIAITVDDGYVDNYDVIFPLVQRYGVPISIFIVKEYLEGHIKFSWDDERQPALSKDHIAEMLASGLVEFYPHTTTHPLLASLPLEQQRKEIVESKEWIENLLSTFRNLDISKSLPYLPDIFAYPSGIPGVDFTKETQQLVCEAGFPMAVSVKGYSKQENLDLTNVERRIVINEPLWMFKLRCAGVIEWVKNLIRPI